jgi:hypothetical protein
MTEDTPRQGRFNVVHPSQDTDSIKDRLRQFKDTLPDAVLSVSGSVWGDEDFVIRDLEKQIVGFQRIVAWLLMEQGRSRVEIPYSVILELSDTAELVIWKNHMTEGRVIELHGAPEGYDYND